MGEPGVTSREFELLRQVLDLLTPEGARADATATTYAVLEVLEELLHSDFVSFQKMAVSPGARLTHSYVQNVEHGVTETWTAQELAEIDQLERCNILEQYWWQLPCSEVDRTHQAGVSTIRSRLGAREWANHPVRADYLRFVDELLMAYPCPHGESLRILAARESGSPFGQRERTCMELLLPHLRPLLEAAVAEQQPDPSRPDGPTSLSLRQGEILRMVALGMSNRELGKRLGITEGTVRKHLENAYARLGVQSRTEAVFRLRAAETASLPAAVGQLDR